MFWGEAIDGDEMGRRGDLRGAPYPSGELGATYAKAAAKAYTVVLEPTVESHAILRM